MSRDLIATRVLLAGACAATFAIAYSGASPGAEVASKVGSVPVKVTPEPAHQAPRLGEAARLPAIAPRPRPPAPTLVRAEPAEPPPVAAVEEPAEPAAEPAAAPPAPVPVAPPPVQEYQPPPPPPPPEPSPPAQEPQGQTFVDSG